MTGWSRHGRRQRVGGLRGPAPGQLLFLIAVLTFAVYWPGLSGPYLLDDSWNLSPFEAWRRGTLSWQRALLPNRTSFLDSRPVAMA
ncbi:MAG TPA: hypothetical protein VLK29_01385, partial [Luteimonas sp.]|nr:hypothetical protein [Luteimonas sp.]